MSQTARCSLAEFLRFQRSQEEGCHKRKFTSKRSAKKKMTERAAL